MAQERDMITEPSKSPLIIEPRQASFARGQPERHVPLPYDYSANRVFVKHKALGVVNIVAALTPIAPCGLGSRLRCLISPRPASYHGEEEVLP